MRCCQWVEREAWRAGLANGVDCPMQMHPGRQSNLAREKRRARDKQWLTFRLAYDLRFNGAARTRDEQRRAAGGDGQWLGRVDAVVRHHPRQHLIDRRVRGVASKLRHGRRIWLPGAEEACHTTPAGERKGKPTQQTKTDAPPQPGPGGGTRLRLIGPPLCEQRPQRAVHEAAGEHLPHALPVHALVEAAAVVVRLLLRQQRACGRYRKMSACPACAEVFKHLRAAVLHRQSDLSPHSNASTAEHAYVHTLAHPARPMRVHYQQCPSLLHPPCTPNSLYAHLVRPAALNRSK